MMAAYYNEFDPFAAQWLRELIKKGLIADGEVDERSIIDVRPDDLNGFEQCHFFAGIGVWSHALRKAGWPDDRQVWTGSCPCQPFSAAGKGSGFDDERHLWPHFHWLINQCRPSIVLGEQVASKDGLGWLDLVQADLEGSGYASAAVDTCAAGFGAPHIRQRMYWMAYSSTVGQLERWTGISSQERDGSARDSAVVGMVNGVGEGLEGHRCGLEAEGGRKGEVRPVAEASEFGGMGNSENIHSKHRTNAGSLGSSQCALQRKTQRQGYGATAGITSSVHQGQPCPTNGFWSDADWLYCRDGKWRPVEPGTFPLANGAPARVGRLRGYGNAIVAPQAQAFIEAVIETLKGE